MTKHRILVAGEYSKSFYDAAAQFGEVIQIVDLDDQPLDDVTILVVRSKTKVTEGLVDRMPNLGCVVSATHGLDHVCLEYLKERGIAFHNVPAQSYDVSQGVIAYILAFSTNLVDGDRSLKQGKWIKKELQGFRIKGKTLGIIGYGRIGKEVARMASALDMKIVVYDPYINTSEFAVSLNELLKTSDIITIHVPLTAETQGILGKAEIQKMKRGVILINTARGRVLDEAEVLAALHRRKLQGVALDVYCHTPPFTNSISQQLIQDERVIATPHSIGQTLEAVEEKGKGVIAFIQTYVESTRAE